jgi:methylenetetrahydrofolate reductase (NADPH)
MAISMRISEIYRAGKFGLSFELFPPKTAEGEANLFEHVRRLVSYRPSLITCTYGAGGSTQGKTLEIVGRVRREFQLPVATHLTCVGRTVEELRKYLDQAKSTGVENVVALRGDPPRGDPAFRPVEGGLAHANELVALIRSEYRDLGIAVAGYPETHQEAQSAEVDLEYLKRKVATGADAVITQLFYDNVDFFRFRERCGALGITVPIVPGLLPITNFSQVKRITSLCGAKLPSELVAGLESAGDDEAAQFAMGIGYAVRQTSELVEAGVPGIHFYVLNRSEAAARVLDQVSLPSGL